MPIALLVKPGPVAGQLYAYVSPAEMERSFAVVDLEFNGSAGFRTTKPFVTKVSDVLCGKASFCDGHVVLVGDALATCRPHAVEATDLAASHCLELARVWRGQITMAIWEQQACANAKKLYLWSRLMGNLGRGTWFSFLRSVFRTWSLSPAHGLDGRSFDAAAGQRQGFH